MGRTDNTKSRFIMKNRAKPLRLTITPEAIKAMDGLGKFIREAKDKSMPTLFPIDTPAMKETREKISAIFAKLNPIFKDLFSKNPPGVPAVITNVQFPEPGKAKRIIDYIDQ